MCPNELHIVQVQHSTLENCITKTKHVCNHWSLKLITNYLYLGQGKILRIRLKKVSSGSSINTGMDGRVITWFNEC